MSPRAPLHFDWPFNVAAVWTTASLLGGCSLAFHANANQCASTSDCTVRGASFANTVCSQGTCTLTVAPLPEAGVEAGVVDPDAAPVVADSGMDASAQCRTFADCPTPLGGHPEVACSPDTHTCLQLTSDQCPLVIGDYRSSKQVSPVIIGGFATILSNVSPTGHPSFRNYQLAVDEFTNQLGIPAGPSGALRTPVVVVCNDDPTQTDTALQHLVLDVHVPAVVAALDSAHLRVAFNNYGYMRTANLFMINPFGADSTLTALPRGQQLWHMLGTPNDLAPAYRALMPRIEGYIRNSLPWRLGATSTMRVATVTARATVLTDLAGAVQTQPITWNNGNAGFGPALTSAYDPETITDSALNGTLPNHIDVTTAVNNLIAFKPHVVVSFASDEFVTLLQTLDLRWQTEVPAQPPPVYVLSPYNADSTAVRTWVGQYEERRRRVLGINFASTTETRVLTNYESRFIQASNPASTLGSENYYDAMYFAIDSLVGAASSTGHAGALTGTDLGGGMLRLTSLAGTPYDMGPADMGNVFSTLGSNNTSTIRLSGALGSPVFDTSTGARVGQGDVYCVTIHPATDGGPATTVFTPDVLRLTPSTDGGAPTLEGDGSCSPGL